MKFSSKIVLAIFILFIATPTFLATIDDSIDTSYFYNMSEEENHGTCNEIKFLSSNFSISFLEMNFDGLQKNKFSFFNDVRLTSIAQNIFLPPPKLI